MELTRENISLYCQIGTMLNDICEKYFDKVADDTWQFYSDWGVYDDKTIRLYYFYYDYNEYLGEDTTESGHIDVNIDDLFEFSKTFEKKETTTCNLTCDDYGKCSSITVKPMKEEDIRCNVNIFPVKDWVTREKNGELTIHTSIHKPWKEKVYGNEYWINGQLINLGQFLVGTVIHDDELLKKYEHLTWNDEPVCIKTYSDDELCAKYFGEGK